MIFHFIYLPKAQVNELRFRAFVESLQKSVALRSTLMYLRALCKSWLIRPDTSGVSEVAAEVSGLGINFVLVS